MKSHRWHSSLGKLTHTTLNADINVTPLVDVCLVLLIIFMVVTPMLQKGVPINLPITEDPEKTPDTEKQLQISVKADGSVYLGSTVVRKEQVQSELEQIHQRTPDREIAVKGDKLVKYGAVLDVLKACREVGFNNVGRSEEHTSELQSQFHLVCRLLLEKKKKKHQKDIQTDTHSNNTDENYDFTYIEILHKSSFRHKSVLYT